MHHVMLALRVKVAPEKSQSVGPGRERGIRLSPDFAECALTDTGTLRSTETAVACPGSANHRLLSGLQ